MKEFNKRKNIIRTNDLLKDRKEEIRVKIESILLILLLFF